MKKQSNTISTSKRIIGLDAFRSAAILIVMLQHGQNLLGDSSLTRTFTQLFNIVDGVSIFFVLSGFLIGKIIINQFIEKEISSNLLIQFWCKRWLRTLPNYFLLLFFFAFLLLLNPRLEFLIIPKSYYFFVQNFTENQLLNFKESWSLSVEEWFYLLFPLLLFGFLWLFKSKYKLKILLSIILLFLLIPLIIRNLQFLQDDTFEFRKVVVYRLDAIVYGVFASYIAFKFEDFFTNNKYIFAVAGMLIYLITLFNISFWKVSYLPFYYSIEALAIMLMLPVFSTIKTFKFKLIDSTLVYISSVSYSLYLVNLTLVQIVIIRFFKEYVKSIVHSSSYLQLIVYCSFWMFSFAIASLMYYFFERPILRWRNRIFID